MSTSRRVPIAERKDPMCSRTSSFDREAVGEPVERKRDGADDAMV
jgi:hypothetical protein